MNPRNGYRHLLQLEDAPPAAGGRHNNTPWAHPEWVEPPYDSATGNRRKAMDPSGWLEQRELLHTVNHPVFTQRETPPPVYTGESQQHIAPATNYSRPNDAPFVPQVTARPQRLPLQLVATETVRSSRLGIHDINRANQQSMRKIWQKERAEERKREKDMNPFRRDDDECSRHSAPAQLGQSSTFNPHAQVAPTREWMDSEFDKQVIEGLVEDATSIWQSQLEGGATARR